VHQAARGSLRPTVSLVGPLVDGFLAAAAAAVGFSRLGLRQPSPLLGHAFVAVRRELEWDELLAPNRLYEEPVDGLGEPVD
jgi:hypothetical protein